MGCYTGIKRMTNNLKVWLQEKQYEAEKRGIKVATPHLGNQEEWESILDGFKDKCGNLTEGVMELPIKAGIA